MRFALWLESDWTPFLSKHFENPSDESVLLVFADWLEEHGESGFAEAIRYIMNGRYRETKTKLPNQPVRDKEWATKASQLLVPIYDRLKEKVKFPTDGGYTFTIRRTKYTVVDDGIVKTGSHDRINPNKWTQDLVEAAVFVLIRGLTSSIPDRHRGENRETKRPSSLAERQFQGRLHQLIKDANYISATLQMAQFNGLQTDRDRQHLQDHLNELDRNAQYVSHMLPDMYTKKADPGNLKDEITDLIRVFGELVRRAQEIDMRAPMNVRLLSGDLTYWQIHHNRDED